MAEATLLVIQGADQGTRFRIGENEFCVGRGIHCEFRIHDTEVSREHATISYDDGTFVLTDCNSSNGTFVNGRPIRIHELSGGDQIQIGRSVILFRPTAPGDDSPSVADRVDFLGHQDPDDHSSIVGYVGQDAGKTLLERPADAPKQDLSQTLANLQVLYRISEEAVSPLISVKQVNYRVKGTEMFWNDPQGAEAILQVRAATLSEDDRLKAHLSTRPGYPFTRRPKPTSLSL